MPKHIFFSWQSDTPTSVGRNLVEAALERAIGLVRQEIEIDPAVRDLAVDKDTKGVPGSPPIADTIFAKIDAAALFLSDLTFVALRANGDGIPNPNVSIEHGWALKSLGPRRVISVMNTAMGHPKDHPLPFDVRHIRWPILYECPEEAEPAQKGRAKAELIKAFVGALKEAFGDSEVLAGLRPPMPAAPHPHDVELLSRVRQLLSLGLRHFLHEHNFGTPFPLARLGPVHELNRDWLGAAYEFSDEALQKSFADLRAASEAFGDLVLQRIYAVDGNPKMGTPKTRFDIERGSQPSTAKAVADMNAAAAALSAAIDDFDRLARERVRVASGLHVETEKPELDLREAQAEAALNGLALDPHRGGVPEIVSRPRLIVRLAPLAAAEGPRLDVKLVSEVQLRFPPSANGAVKAEADGQQWWSCAQPREVADRPNPETTWLMRLVRPGNLEFQVTIGARVGDDPEILIDGRRLEARIVRSLEQMAFIAVDLGLAGPALVSVSLDGIESVELTRARPGGRRLRQNEIVLPTVRLEGLDGPLAGTLREAFDVLWLTAGWKDGSPSFGTGEWAGYADPRNYAPD